MKGAVYLQSQKGSLGNGESAAEGVQENVQNARQWIAEWRAGDKEESVSAR